MQQSLGKALGYSNLNVSTFIVGPRKGRKTKSNLSKTHCHYSRYNFLLSFPSSLRDFRFLQKSEDSSRSDIVSVSNLKPHNFSPKCEVRVKVS